MPVIQQAVRPFQSATAQGVNTPTAVQEPQIVRIHPGRGGSVKALTGSYHLVVTRYLTRFPTEVISD
jgi:hypothetical protein